MRIAKRKSRSFANRSEAEDYAAIEQIAAVDPLKALALGFAWMPHMRAGNYARAWQVSDEVLRRRAGRTPHHLP